MGSKSSDGPGSEKRTGELRRLIRKDSPYPRASLSGQQVDELIQTWRDISEANLDLVDELRRWRRAVWIVGALVLAATLVDFAMGLSERPERRRILQRVAESALEDRAGRRELLDAIAAGNRAKLKTLEAERTFEPRKMIEAERAIREAMVETEQARRALQETEAHHDD